MVIIKEITVSTIMAGVLRQRLGPRRKNVSDVLAEAKELLDSPADEVHHSVLKKMCHKDEIIC